MESVLEYDHNIFDAQQAEADKNLLVRFFTMAIQNDNKSVEAGRPIFDDTEMVEIRVRGTKDNIVIRPIRQSDLSRFRGAYRAYKDGKSEMNSGTPLSQWPALTVSQVEEFKHLGFMTVEHLAGANDGVISSISGLRTFVNKAKAFLELSKGGAPIERMQKELDDKANELQTVQNQLREMALRLSAMEQDRKDQQQEPGKAPTRK